MDKLYKINDEQKERLADTVCQALLNSERTLEEWDDTYLTVNFLEDNLVEVESEIPQLFIASNPAMASKKDRLMKLDHSEFTEQECDLANLAIHGKLFTRQQMENYAMECTNNAVCGMGQPHVMLVQPEHLDIWLKKKPVEKKKSNFQQRINDMVKQKENK